MVVTYVKLLTKNPRTAELAARDSQARIRKLDPYHVFMNGNCSLVWYVYSLKSRRISDPHTYNAT